MLAQVPATWPNKQPPDGLAEQVSDLRPETWMLVGRIGGHMGFHIGNRVEVVIAQGTEPALDGGVDGVGLAYADTVHSTIQSWLSTLSDDDLDTVPDMEAHMASYTAYQHPGFRAEIADLLGQPIWRLLIGPCSGHLREHLGELDVLKQVMRGGMCECWAEQCLVAGADRQSSLTPCRSPS